MHKIDPTFFGYVSWLFYISLLLFLVVNIYLCLSINGLKTFTALQTSILVLSNSPCTIDGALDHIGFDVLCQERPATQECPFVETGMYYRKCIVDSSLSVQALWVFLWCLLKH